MLTVEFRHSTKKMLHKNDEKRAHGGLCLQTNVNTFRNITSCGGIQLLRLTGHYCLPSRPYLPGLVWA